ncbi:MAG TPA: hypothetical protein VN846_02345 [Candidatus Cybelea sp.]|jgi:hypothetical protein|nr:hypothetical protein [Candidatus Cybelea sp.]
MMRTTNVLLLSWVIVVLTAQISFAKNGNIGIYGVVDKVVFEPNEHSPERIQIWGLFVVPVEMSSGEYRAPQRGVLYFKLPPGRESAVRKEWTEIKKIAGTGQPIGFAQYWVLDRNDPQANLHTSLEVQVHRNLDFRQPDLYPPERGIVRTNDGKNPDFECIVTRLKTNASRPAVAGGCREASN